MARHPGLALNAFSSSWMSVIPALKSGSRPLGPGRADRLESQPCRRTSSGEPRWSGGFQLNGLCDDLDAVSGAVSQAFELGSCIPVLPMRENLVPVKDSYLVSFKPPPKIAVIGHHHASHLDGDLQN